MKIVVHVAKNKKNIWKNPKSWENSARLTEFIKIPKNLEILNKSLKIPKDLKKIP